MVVWRLARPCAGGKRNPAGTVDVRGPSCPRPVAVSRCALDVGGVRVQVLVEAVTSRQSRGDGRKPRLTGVTRRAGRRVEGKAHG